MTSQKSLKNNVNFNDFKRSLKESAMFPVIALFVLLFSVTFAVIDFVTSPSFIQSEGFGKIAQILLPNNNMFGDMPEYLFAGMTLCGLFMALKSFYFLLSKKQVNVYLSLGVTRTRMLVNKFLAAIVWLFLVTFIPIFIVFIVNVVKFGITSFMTFTFIYFVSGLFVSSVTGFAIGTIAITISGNLFECALTTVSLSALPTIIYDIFITLRYNYLRGVSVDMVRSGLLKTLNPLTFVNNISEIDYNNYNRYVTLSEVLGRITKDAIDSGELVKKIGNFGNFIIPLVIWLCVSAVLLALANALLNKRKAEYSHSFGHFTISRTVVSTFAFGLAIWVIIQEISYKNEMLPVFLYSIVVSILAWLAVQLVMSRKIKASLKSLTVWVALVGVTALGFIAIDTGYFGTFNKLPEKENIKNVSFSFNEWDTVYNTVNINFDYVVSTKPEDIEMVVGLFNEIKKDDGKREDIIGDVEFAIETKDGEIMYRQFRVFNLDLYVKYLESTYNSDLFDAVLENKLIGFNEKNMSSNKYYSLHKADGVLQLPDEFEEGSMHSFHYVDNQMVVAHEYDYEMFGGASPKVKITTDWNDRVINLNRGDELAVALYNDLSKMSFDDLFRNTEKPVATLGYATSVCINADMVIKPSTDSNEIYSYSYSDKLKGDYAEYYENDILIGTSKDLLEYTVDATFFIYPQMTETIKYFKDNNITFAGQYKGEIKEVYYTYGPMKYSSACSAYEDKNPGRFFDEWGKLFNTNPDYTFFTSGLSTNLFRELKGCINKDTKVLDLIKEVYKEADMPLLKLKDTEVDKVLEQCTSNYFVHKDNGKYVYVVYEDGTIINYYLPEANVGILQ